MRRYGDPVEVRTAIDQLEGLDGEVAPDAFIWRGRLYVVGTVLARWHERRAWWRDPAASSLLGLGSDDVSAVSTEPALTGECRVWRVEAAAGRSSPVGVYDMVHTPGPSDTWHLARVAD